MYVMRASDLLKEVKLRPMQQLRDEGLVVQRRPEMSTVFFISHQVRAPYAMPTAACTLRCRTPVDPSGYQLAEGLVQA